VLISGNGVLVVLLGLPLTHIGRVAPCAAGEAPTVAIAGQGVAARVDLPPGHDHFSQ
jgi:hypothetical protein